MADPYCSTVSETTKKWLRRLRGGGNRPSRSPLVAFSAAEKGAAFRPAERTRRPELTFQRRESRHRAGRPGDVAAGGARGARLTCARDRPPGEGKAPARGVCGPTVGRGLGAQRQRRRPPTYTARTDAGARGSERPRWEGSRREGTPDPGGAGTSPDIRPGGRPGSRRAGTPTRAG